MAEKSSEQLVYECVRLLDLVVAEFKSDPMSVQCFDLNAIVSPSIETIDRLRLLGVIK